jgi:hypothetical protein
MGMPISVTTDRSWLLDLTRVDYIGPLVVFGIAIAPAVVSVGVFELVRVVCWLFRARNPLTQDWAMAVGLLASVPWNVVLRQWRIRIRALWLPMWLLCTILGAFGVLQATGRV